MEFIIILGLSNLVFKVFNLSLLISKLGLESIKVIANLDIIILKISGLCLPVIQLLRVLIDGALSVSDHALKSTIGQLKLVNLLIEMDILTVEFHASLEVTVNLLLIEFLSFGKICLDLVSLLSKMVNISLSGSSLTLKEGLELANLLAKGPGLIL